MPVRGGNGSMSWEVSVTHSKQLHLSHSECSSWLGLSDTGHLFIHLKSLHCGDNPTRLSFNKPVHEKEKSVFDLL